MEDMVEEGEREGQGIEERMRRRGKRGEKEGWWGERTQKAAMEGHLQRWHLIQHNLSHSGYCTVT